MVLILSHGSRDQTDASVFSRNAKTSNPTTWWMEVISRKMRKENADQIEENL